MLGRRKTRGRPDLVGKVAIVTGGGSGIGAALTRALVAEGAHVTCADIDLSAAQQVASLLHGGPGTVRAVRLDVTDGAAVQRVVDDIVTESGCLDLLFNNAGITWGGPTEMLSPDQWNAIIDVNIRGVVHGVAAAYPVMIEQRSGHIVNTASMAGLVAAGLITSYVMTKHAVVGLSLALRTEAAGRGVNVMAVCPSAVETPILDKGSVGGFVGRSYYLASQGSSTAYDADRLAQDTLAAIGRNQPLLVVPRRSRITWRVQRLAPALTNRLAAQFIDRQRGQLRPEG
ncbi:SDR family NAD(P)-dependent oxidoreductase [Gordonia sp. NPDC058843]|uniref:SDR family NAD(P)-dependent oxidoreductase n=1 Tax=Gordonia sp. NPDC058843 TaxID=3346648 RepID=UPI0036AA857C